MINNPQYIISAGDLADVCAQSKEDILDSLGKQGLIKMPGGKWGIPPQIVKAYLSEKGVDYSFKVIAYVNLKGGTGKTTSAISAATRSVQYGFKTCLLDMDSQANASLAFDRIPEEDDPIFYDIWQNPAEMVMETLKIVEDRLYIIPSALENSLLDVKLMNPDSQKNAVRDVCDVVKNNGFDLVMIDCPPSLGTAVISTICAADIVIIPVCCDAFSLKGLEFTLEEIKSICETFHLKIPRLYILVTKFDKRLNITKNSLKRISSLYPEYLIPFPIRTSSEFTRELERKRTVFALTTKSRAKNDYDRYIRYILNLDKHLNQGGVR